CFACQTILDAHAGTDGQGDKGVEREATDVSVRILRSRGYGTLTPPSEGEVAGRGGSGSKSRGRIPGSRNAYGAWWMVCGRKRCKALTVASMHETVRRHM